MEISFKSKGKVKTSNYETDEPFKSCINIRTFSFLRVPPLTPRRLERILRDNGIQTKCKTRKHFTSTITGSNEDYSYKITISPFRHEYEISSQQMGLDEIKDTQLYRTFRSL